MNTNEDIPVADPAVVPEPVAPIPKPKYPVSITYACGHRETKMRKSPTIQDRHRVELQAKPCPNCRNAAAKMKSADEARARALALGTGYVVRKRHETVALPPDTFLALRRTGPVGWRGTLQAEDITVHCQSPDLMELVRNLAAEYHIRYRDQLINKKES